MYRFTIIVLLFTSLVWGQQNEVIITGKVTDGVAPIEDVNISVSNSDNGTKTAGNGFYSLRVNEGALLKYSHVGFETVEILAEDISRTLNIILVPEIKELDNVTVIKTKPRKTQKELFQEYNTNPNLIKTMFGILDKDIVGYSMRTVDEKDIKIIYPDLSFLISNRFAGVSSRCNRGTGLLETIMRKVNSLGNAGGGGSIYEVDGMVFESLPCAMVDISNIKRIAVIPSYSGLTKYGTMAKGGIVIINTKSGNFSPGANGTANYDQAKLRNNSYGNDAIAFKTSNNIPEYLRQLRNSTSEEEAKKIYSERLEQYGTSYVFVLDSYQYFLKEVNNQKFADSIIEENKELFNSDPLALKALAYNYQEEGRLEKANELYKELFILRANYGQSYMDLANSYREIGEYKRAAAMYARYGYLLEEGFLRVEDDLNMIMERELNNLIALKGEDLLSKKELKSLVLDDEFDVTRLVFEWNDSEAEFELQFVNPEGNYFKSEHSLFADAEGVKDKKISGFSSEEYLIDDSIKGVWKVNAKYFGNKSLTPTYLKATIYHNYGSASQRKETKLFKLSLKNVNQQLFTVSNAISIVSN
ncbi:carboxypeptidase-like regulatory domain-containing protein [Maribacter sp. R77961]|uniref:carboxypeptidase-like regulatory domain-containing protein n=1 Tax=Maribacter sp. R77961 TaxID=3093871 RepID=UPI0037C523E1